MSYLKPSSSSSFMLIASLSVFCMLVAPTGALYAQCDNYRLIIEDFGGMMESLSVCIARNAEAECRLDMNMVEFEDLTREYIPNEVRYIRNSAPGTYSDASGNTRSMDVGEGIVRDFCDGSVQCELVYPRTSNTQQVSRNADVSTQAGVGRRGLRQATAVHPRHSFVTTLPRTAGASHVSPRGATRTGGATLIDAPRVESFNNPDQISARWGDVMSGGTGRNAAAPMARLVGPCARIATQIDNIFN